MLMRSNNVFSKRPETSKEQVLKSLSESSNSVDIPAPHNLPLSVYNERPPTVAKDNKVITIGTGVVFSGKVIEADNVRLEGTADGEITAKTVEISAAGALDGTVQCDTLIVAGTFSGEATVASSLSVKSTGRIEGKISYGSLSVEAGGAVLGTLEMCATQSSPATSLEELVGASPKPG
jgi:cytoskeletal protein CcmA (bactofilin family)